MSFSELLGDDLRRWGRARLGLDCIDCGKLIGDAPACEVAGFYVYRAHAACRGVAPGTLVLALG